MAADSFSKVVFVQTGGEGRRRRRRNLCGGCGGGEREGRRPFTGKEARAAKRGPEGERSLKGPCPAQRARRRKELLKAQETE